MSYRDTVAAKARKEKQDHPDRFCHGHRNCLWRTHDDNGNRVKFCKRHEQELLQKHLAERKAAGLPTGESL
jgi:hypothetical protein